MPTLAQAFCTAVSYYISALPAHLPSRATDRWPEKAAAQHCRLSCGCRGSGGFCESGEHEPFLPQRSGGKSRRVAHEPAPYSSQVARLAVRRRRGLAEPKDKHPGRRCSLCGRRVEPTRTLKQGGARVELEWDRARFRPPHARIANSRRSLSIQRPDLFVASLTRLAAAEEADP
jgi:hypothetical protein